METRTRRDSLVAFFAAVLGAFGLVTAIVIVQHLVAAIVPGPAIGSVRDQSMLQQHAVDIVVWLTAPVVVGAVYPSRRGAAYVGVLMSLLAFLILDANRAGVPEGEWSAFGRAIENAIRIAYALVAATLVVLGAQLGTGADRRARVRGRGSKAVYSVAAVGVIVMTVTLALSSVLPDGNAYAVDLSPEWTEAPYTGIDTTYGTDFRAELGPPERLDYYNPPKHPVVGVSVVSLPASAAPSDCFGAFNGWPGNPMLSRTEGIRAGDTLLPVGPAYEWIGRRDGLTFYSYSFGRERRIVFDSRQLCYMLVVTVPDTATLTQTEARAIAEGFRYL